MNSLLPLLILTLLPFLSQSYPLARSTLTDLTSTDWPTFQIEASTWSLDRYLDSSIKASDCSGTYYLGGFYVASSHGTFSKIYNDLPAHDVIHFSFNFGLIDSWDANGDELYIEFGATRLTVVKGFYHGNFGAPYLCGVSYYRDLRHYQVQGRVFHDSSSLDLKLIGVLDSASDNESFGVRDVLLVFLTDVSERDEEIYGQAASFAVDGFKYDCTYDFAKNSCASCHENCLTCFGNENGQCLECAAGYFFNGDMCEYCFMHSYDPINCYTECEYPLISDPAVKNTCKYPCENGQVVWSDGTCHDYCEYPLLMKNYPMGNACEYICGGNQGIAMFAYDFEEDGCYDYCPGPLVKGLGVCDAPMCGKKRCRQCEKTSDCGEYHYCDLEIGGFCLFNVEYQLSASIVKSITNGYLLLIEVIPSIDLNELIDNILEIEVEDLVLNKDYKLEEIKKVKIGVFQVAFRVLHSLLEEGILINFRYSPNRLRLQTEITLPNLVYISENILAASENINSASNVTSYIFIIIVVCFAILGNLNKVWSCLAINQYMHFLLYLSIEFLSPTQTYLESLGNYSLVFFQGDQETAYTDPEILKDLKMSWPVNFIEANYPINLFKNTRQIYGILGIMACVIGIAAFAAGFGGSILRRISKRLKWNMMIQQTMTYSLPLMIASLMQINLGIFSPGRTSILFVVISGMSCLFLVRFYWKAIGILQNIPFSMYDRMVYSDKYGALWRGLDLKAKKSRYYYCVVGFRGVFLAYIVAFFDRFPYVQLVGVILYQMLVISFYLQGSLVFAEKGLNRFCLTAEALLLVMKIVILGFKLVIDKSNNEKIRVYIALGIVGIGVFIQVLLLGFSVWMQVKMRKKIVEKSKDLWRMIMRKEKKMKIRKFRSHRRNQTKKIIEKVDVSQVRDDFVIA